MSVAHGRPLRVLLGYVDPSTLRLAINRVWHSLAVPLAEEQEVLLWRSKKMELVTAAMRLVRAQTRSTEDRLRHNTGTTTGRDLAPEARAMVQLLEIHRNVVVEDDGVRSRATKGRFNITSTRVFRDRWYEKKH